MPFWPLGSSSTGVLPLCQVLRRSLQQVGLGRSPSFYASPASSPSRDPVGRRFACAWPRLQAPPAPPTVESETGLLSLRGTLQPPTSVTRDFDSPPRPRPSAIANLPKDNEEAQTERRPPHDRRRLPKNYQDRFSWGAPPSPMDVQDTQPRY